MKITKLVLEGYRNFRERTLIDFTDPYTGAPLDRVVLAGSNGSGKTSVLDACVGLVGLLIGDSPKSSLGKPIGVALTIDDVGRLIPDEHLDGLPSPHDLALGFGRREWLDEVLPGMTSRLGCFWPWDVGGTDYMGYTPAVQAVSQAMREGQGGLVLIPSDRLLPPPNPDEPARIERPDLPDGPVTTYRSPNQRKLSLEQYLVWLNYLDLEARQLGEEGNQFQEALERVRIALPPERTPYVREGRVYCGPVDGNGDESQAVRLHELPSGEQQWMLIMLELTRVARPGSIILIDEPEISLHPSMQAMLLRQLDQLSKAYDWQVILATHSGDIVRACPTHQLRVLDHLDAEGRTAGLSPAVSEA
ncbi:MAG: AAA family ATPase [Armatimonadia bacterium]|nr:AAA family ATPase [Armatimonadia bacterium]